MIVSEENIAQLCFIYHAVCANVNKLKLKATMCRIVQLCKLKLLVCLKIMGQKLVEIELKLGELL